MTLYLTDNTSAEEVHRASGAGIVAFKLYPAGATTNSDSGVTDTAHCFSALQAMAEASHWLITFLNLLILAVIMHDKWYLAGNI